MHRTNLAGLAAATLGLAIVVAGLRTAVASGGKVCSGSNTYMGGISIGCDGACPGTDNCHLLTEYFTSLTKSTCGCFGAGDMYPYTPLDAPKCGLAMFEWETYDRMGCVLQGCRGECGEPVPDGLGVTCACSK